MYNNTSSLYFIAPYEQFPTVFLVNSSRTSRSCKLYIWYICLLLLSPYLVPIFKSELDHSHFKSYFGNYKMNIDHRRSDYNHFKSYLSHYQSDNGHRESEHSQFRSYLSHYKNVILVTNKVVSAT